MKAIIIDDERLARQELKNLLSAHKEIEVIAECSDAIQAKEKINELKPDVIFCDIQMREMTTAEANATFPASIPLCYSSILES